MTLRPVQGFWWLLAEPAGAAGLLVFRSKDAATAWAPQPGPILHAAGSRPDDGSDGGAPCGARVRACADAPPAATCKTERWALRRARVRSVGAAFEVAAPRLCPRSAVVVDAGRAFVFYTVHPGRPVGADVPYAQRGTAEYRASVIQVTGAGEARPNTAPQSSR